MKRIAFGLIVVLFIVCLMSCNKPTRCSYFNNKDYSGTIGPVTLEIDYSFSINAKVSVNVTESVRYPLTLAIDGVVVDSIDAFPWNKKYQINMMHIGKHYFTLTYSDGQQDNSLIAEFWVCSRSFNWDKMDE